MTNETTPTTAAGGSPLERGVGRLTCWWFGCIPDYDAMRHDCEVIPCERCEAPDTSYSDRVGDTRHARFVNSWRWLYWRAIGRWLPTKCLACGKRFGCKPDCDGIPF